MSFTPGPGTTYLLTSTQPVPTGTANGVLYLNGSKVVTSGSALTFNGTILDTPKIATASYAQISATIGRTGDFGQSLELVRSGVTGNAGFGLTAQNQLGFYLNSTEAMRLNSTGLGIGTSSPSVKLEVAAGAGFPTAKFTRVGTTAQTGAASIGMSQIGFAGSTNADTILRSDYGFGLQVNSASSPLTAMAVDLSGNIGLGVTPQAWSTRALEIIGGVGISSVAGLDFTLNAYYNAGWLYRSTGAATRYEQVSGQHRWYNAASGTAGNPISFTQAMTLNASGNLGIGTTSPKSNAGYATLTLNNAVNGGVLQFTQADTTIGQLFFDGNGGTLRSVSNDPLVFGTNNTERVQIKATGQLRFVPLAADPSGAEAGDVYYNSGTNKLRLYDGSTWVDLN